MTRWIPRPLPSMFVLLAIFALGAGAWVCKYALPRTAALAYAERFGSVTFQPLPDWCPERCCPAWLRAVNEVYLGPSAAGLKAVISLRELHGLEANCSLDDDEFRTVRSFHYLESLKLGKTKVTDAALAALEDCERLKTFKIESPGITGAGLETLVRLPLSSPCLSGTQVTDAGAVHLGRISTLETLDLRDTRVTDAGLAELSRLTSLTYLSLSGTPVTGAGLKHLVGVPLRYLWLSRSAVTDLGLSDLPKIATLRQLDFIETQIADPGLKHLATLPLTQLNLSKTQITDVGLAELARVSTLTQLYLSETQVGDAGVEYLSELPLTHLGLSRTAITDACLSRLTTCPLEHLSLWDTAVTPQGLKALAGMKTLGNLSVSESAFTESDVAELKAVGLPIMLLPF